MDKNIDVTKLNPGTLAYVGDAVFSLEVRARLIAEFGDLSSKALNVKAAGYVSAVAQAKILDRIEMRLNEFETDLIRRARNMHDKSVAKNATLNEYKRATGLEAILGYYYLTEDVRLGEIIDMIFN